VDYHDPTWPARIRGQFDGVLSAASGTAAAALPLVRDGGWLCSITSDAPPPQRGITSTDLYVRPDAAQLAHLARRFSQGALHLTAQPLPLNDGPAAYIRAAAGRVGGRKIVLIP
jgi:hypothetical protein